MNKLDKIAAGMEEFVASGRQSLPGELVAYSACSSDGRVRFSADKGDLQRIAEAYGMTFDAVVTIIEQAKRGFADDERLAELEHAAFDKRRSRTARLDNLCAAVLAGMWRQFCHRAAGAAE